MSIFSNLTNYVRSFFAGATNFREKWLTDYFGGDEDHTDAGVSITGKTVLEYAPVWSLVSKIAGHVAQIPCNVMTYDDAERQVKVVASRHPAQRLVKYRANRYMAADVFMETMQAHALLWGNGRAAILRNNRNDPTELVILLPDRTRTVLINGEKWHSVTDKETQEIINIPDSEVIHIAGLGYDGIAGYSLIEMARNSIGLGIASEKHMNRHFRNNSKPSIVLEAPPGAFKTEAEAKTFLDNWNSYHGGLSNTSKASLLRNGVKATPLSMSGQDAQWIEQRKFQRQEAALWLVCEQILGDDSSVSYNSLEQKSLAYLTNCLNRWLVRWELELREKLLTAQQKTADSHYFKFKRNALLQMSSMDRANFYRTLIECRVICPNEARETEDLPPYEGGDEFVNPHITPGNQQGTPELPADDSGASTTKKPVDPEEGYDNADAERQANVTSRLRSLIVSHVSILVNADKRTVVNAAAKEKNFCDWLDSHYGNSAFRANLANSIAQCGGCASDAEAYCIESKEKLLTIAGAARTTDELAAMVEQEVANWHETRINDLANVITSRVEMAQE